ncbi:MAG: 16S rRNA processing protein RimM [Clostridia bacterium]|nr:16S rRNA processing protein RimM [Clostridia bacterium]
MLKDYLELGQIVGTHGIKGEIRINPWCDSPDFAKKFKTVYFDSKGLKSCKIISCRAHGNLILMKLDGIDTIESAQTLRNKVIYIKRADARLPDGTWFIEELIGCEVYDAETQELYGKISDVSETGANDVWHITDENGNEYLIPSIKEVVIEVNVADNKVLIKPLKGIFDNAD